MCCLLRVNPASEETICSKLAKRGILRSKPALQPSGCKESFPLHPRNSGSKTENEAQTHWSFGKEGFTLTSRRMKPMPQECLSLNCRAAQPAVVLLLTWKPQLGMTYMVVFFFEVLLYKQVEAAGNWTKFTLHIHSYRFKVNFILQKIKPIDSTFVSDF